MAGESLLETTPLQTEYTAKDIQVLSGLEPVRKRPGMYIGDTHENGLHHLIFEIVDNSIDEAMAGFCKNIKIVLHKDETVEIVDDGRGIPVDTHPTTGRPALETAMTTLHAGGKFDSLTYKVSGGLHGVGASVVTALSSWMRVEVKREGWLYSQEYERGIPSTDLIKEEKAEGTGTRVLFKPDSEIFETSKFDFKRLSNHFKNTSYLNKGIKISLLSHCDQENGYPFKEINYLFDGGLASMVTALNKHRQEYQVEPYYALKTAENIIVEAAIQYNDSFNENVLSFANCINTQEGGTHLTGFRTALIRVLNRFAKKNQFIKETDPNLTTDDLKAGLTAVISVKLPDPQFEGQTKTKLGNSEVRRVVDSIINETFLFFLEEHPQDAQKIIEKCLVQQKAREAAKKARDLIIRKSSLDGGSLPGKLSDCQEKDPSKSEIYIVEGESAGGSAKMGRDRLFQAILPIKGKILNVQKATDEKMFAHTEIRAIITGLGAGEGETYDASKLRYHTVVIMTDADVDGSHIRTLLLTYFFNRMPDLIANGNLYIAQPPLFQIRVGKSSQYFFNDESKDKYLEQLEAKQRPYIQRYKGLGEMNPDQLWETTMDPQTRTLLKVTNDLENADAYDTFERLMGIEVAPRKSFIQAYANTVKALDV